MNSGARLIFDDRRERWKRRSVWRKLGRTIQEIRIYPQRRWRWRTMVQPKVSEEMSYL